MSVSMQDIGKRLEELEKRVEKLEGEGPVNSKPHELNPHLPICEACGEGNKKMIVHKVRDDIFGKKMNAKMKVYQCDACSITTTVNDSAD